MIRARAKCAGTAASHDTLLIVTTSYPIAGDGSEAAGDFVADFAKAMARHMPVRVVGPGLRVECEEADESLCVWRFSAGERPLSLLSPFKPWHWSAIAKTLISLRRQVFAAADDGRVVHTFALWALPSGWAARDLLRRQGVSYSVWALGSDIWSLGRVPVVSWLLRRVCRDAKRTYADGFKLAHDAGLLTGRKFSFLPTTRSLQSAGRPECRTEPPFRLLFLGRWHPNKGIDLLLEALMLLTEQDWTLIEHVAIYGGGPLEALVHEKVKSAASRGLPVAVHGYLDKKAAQRAIEEADYVVIPSRIESIPVVFSDAVKLGRPVITTPVGDLPELMESNGAGVLATAVTSVAIADAIRAAVISGPANYRLGVAKAAAEFDLDQIAARCAAEIQSYSVGLKACGTSPGRPAITDK